MSNEDRVLALCRDAWRVSRPSDDEIERAAGRVERRMRAGDKPRARTVFPRRPVMVLAFVAVFGGALAYAASGGVPWFGAERKAAPVEIETPKPPAPEPAKALGTSQPGVAPTKTEQQKSEPETQDEKSSPGATTGSETESKGGASAGAQRATPPSGGDRAPAAAGAAPGAATSWRQVDQALAAKDDVRAERALRKLAGDRDPTTRAKAALGMAQLAQSRGDCAEARRRALVAAGVPGADAAVVRRAEALVAACK